MAVRVIVVLCLGALMMAGPHESASAEPAGRITGLGGVFFKAKDPKALAAWYRDVLGLPLEAWGGAALRYAVDDMDAFLARLRAKGVAILKQADDDPNGRFAWILDPEGNKIELWEPKRTAPP